MDIRNCFSRDKQTLPCSLLQAIIFFITMVFAFIFEMPLGWAQEEVGAVPQNDPASNPDGLSWYETLRTQPTLFP